MPALASSAVARKGTDVLVCSSKIEKALCGDVDVEL
jgi:hypothetical protein